MAVTLLSLIALPAVAQSLGAYNQACQTVGGRLVCSPAAGSAGKAGARAYDRWENGSPAGASGSSSEYQYRSYDASQFPNSFRAYNNLGSFGH
jgi:hypothetical protein